MADPARITAITPTAHDPQRATVKVGRKSVATLSLALIDELGLSVDQPWDEALAQRVDEAAQYDKALRKAMHRLTRRAMSRHDLDRKLRDLEFESEVRQRALDRLTELGYLDDEAFGRSLIRELQRAKPAGPRLLRQKLMTKGLDRTLIDQLVEEATADTDDYEPALELARNRLTQLHRHDPTTRLRRVHGLLGRRGFDADTIRRVMETLRSEVDEDGENGEA